MGTVTNDEITNHLTSSIATAREKVSELKELLTHEEKDSHRFNVIYQMIRDLESYIDNMEWTQNFWLYNRETN